jgi:hypothetical protein
MNPRTTGLLLLVAVALGAFVYFREVRGVDEREQAETAAKRLFADTKSTDVDRIELVATDGRRVVAERRGGRWELLEPLAFPGDAVNLDAIAAGLADLSSEKEIESPQAAEVYGLGEGAKTVRFRAAGGLRELRIGRAAPIGASTYVASGAAPERIVTVPTYRVTTLERSVDDLRDRRVTSFDRAAIEGVEVRWPEGGVRLARSDGGWKLVEPIEGRADDTTVDQLLSNLSYLRADSFDDDPGPDSETGLDSPELEIVLHPRPGADGAPAEPIRVRFGAERDTKRPVRGAVKSLYHVPAQRVDDFARRVDAYRYRDLSRFVATDAKRVELRFTSRAGDVFEETLELSDSGWKGSPEPVDPGKVARLVSELARLRADAIVVEDARDADLEGRSLAPPRLRIRVLGGADGEAAAPELGVVEIGDDAGEGPYARTPSIASVFRLSPGVVEWLPTGLDAFRSSFVAKPVEAAAPADAEAPLAPEAATPDAS